MSETRVVAGIQPGPVRTPPPALTPARLVDTHPTTRRPALDWRLTGGLPAFDQLTGPRGWCSTRRVRPSIILPRPLTQHLPSSPPSSIRRLQPGTIVPAPHAPAILSCSSSFRAAPPNGPPHVHPRVHRPTAAPQHRFRFLGRLAFSLGRARWRASAGAVAQGKRAAM